MSYNVCVCAVVGFRSRHCPRGQTLNEDNTLSLHVTPPLRKHFVVASYFLSALNTKGISFTILSMSGGNLMLLKCPAL